MNMKDPTSRLACWNLRLQDYDFDIIHRPGMQQTHVYCLSHLVRALNMGEFSENGLPEPIFNRFNIREAQRADGGLNKMIEALEKEEIIEPFFLDNDGILSRNDSSELPVGERRRSGS